MPGSQLCFTVNKVKYADIKQPIKAASGKGFLEGRREEEEKKAGRGGRDGGKQ